MRFICCLECLRLLVSDNGKPFCAKLFSDLLDKCSINNQFTPKYHIQSNACERVNRSVLSGIRAYINQIYKTWDEDLQEVAHAIRNVVHCYHKFSPHYLLFGQYLISHGSDNKLLR